MPRIRAILAAIVFLTPLAAAAAPYRLEDALTLRTFSELTWSRDGHRLAFVVTEVDTAENTQNQDLWLADLRSGETLRLTRHAKPDISPTFSPGGDTIAFVSTRAVGEEAKPAIYLMSLEGGEPWAFGTYAEGVGEVKWSPDGKYLAYVMTDTLPARIKEWRKKKWDHVVEDERLQYPRLWVVEVATGKQRRLTSDESYIWYLRWSPDSRAIAFIVSPTGKPDDSNAQDIGIVPVDGGPMRKLGVIGDEFAWSSDGRHIAIATGSDRRKFIEKSDLWLVPVAGGNALNLTAEFDGDAQAPAWDPVSSAIRFHAAEGVTSRLVSVFERGDPGRGAPGRPWRGGVMLGDDRNGEAGAPAIAANGNMAWVQSRPLEPPEIWIQEDSRYSRSVTRTRPGWPPPGKPETGETSFGIPPYAITALNAAVAKLELAGTRTVRWTSSDGKRVEGLLVRPRGAAAGARLKTLVMLHGGPYAARFGLAFQPTAQYFAARGYQVFMPNFRASGGYGTEFMLRQRADWGGQDWRDVMTGVDSLIVAGLADPNRLGVLGHSYGGYLSAWAITQTDRFDAACVSAGAVDLASHYGQSDIHQYRAYDFEGHPWQSPEKWARSSPSTHIAKAKTPTLILVGQDDRRVPAPQSRQLYTALTALAVPTEFVHYPREGHTLREYRHRADWHTRIVEWFDRWVK